jgi:hypothetical protein
MAHQPNTFIYIEFKFKMRLRLSLHPLNACVLMWLVGCMERCSCIILHSCKNHELLLMSFPCSCWNPPGSQTSRWSFSCAPLCCCCCFRCAAATFSLPSFSSLVVYADLNISLLMSSISWSSCSCGWSNSYSLLRCKRFWPLGRSS